MLREIKNRAPLLFPYALACYREPSKLFGQGFQLDSSRGVQQGDVCGPALFAIALHCVILRLNELDLNFQNWYLDDGILCGPAEEVNKAIVLLKHLLPALGLGLNLLKCKLLCHVDANITLLRSLDFQQGQRLAEKFSSLFRYSLQHIIGGTCSDIHFALACMSSLRGGLGLKDPRLTHGPAFLASAFSFASNSEDLSPSFWSTLTSAW